MQNYGLDPVHAGFAVGAYIIASIFSRIFAGWKLESFGRRRMLIFGFGWFLIATMLYFVPASYGLFIAIRFFHGAAFGVASNTISTITTDYIPRSRWGEGMGYYSVVGIVAAACGPFLGLIIFTSYGIFSVFVLCAVCAIISFVFCLLIGVREIEAPTRSTTIDAANITSEVTIVDTDANTIPANSKAKKGLKLTDLFEPAALLLSIVSGLTTGVYASMTSFLNAFSITIDAVEAASWFFVVYTIAVVATRPLQGRLLDAGHVNGLMVGTSLVTVAGFVLLAFTQDSTQLLFAAVLMGLGYGNQFATCMADATRNIPNHRMGVALSTFFTFADTSQGIGPVIMGWVLQTTSFAGMHLTCAAITAIGLALYCARRIARPAK